jgi:serine/threonine protein kinase
MIVYGANSEYVLLELLGKGSYGKVYKVKNKNNINMAVKIVSKFNASIKNNEISILKELKSLYIVELLDFGSLEGLSFFFMEFCEVNKKFDLVIKIYFKAFLNKIEWRFEGKNQRAKIKQYKIRHCIN